jgi:hypothetical protein
MWAIALDHWFWSYLLILIFYFFVFGGLSRSGCRLLHPFLMVKLIQPALVLALFMTLDLKLALIKGEIGLLLKGGRT